MCFIPANSDGKPHAAHGMITAGQGRRRPTSPTTSRPPPRRRSRSATSRSRCPPASPARASSTSRTRAPGARAGHVEARARARRSTDAKAFLLTPPGTPPPAGPPPFTAIPGLGGITGLSPQQHAWLDMNLTPGNYVLICFFPDPKKRRPPARARRHDQGVHDHRDASTRPVACARASARRAAGHRHGDGVRGPGRGPPPRRLRRRRGEGRVAGRRRRSPHGLVPARRRRLLHVEAARPEQARGRARPQDRRRPRRAAAARRRRRRARRELPARARSSGSGSAPTCCSRAIRASSCCASPASARTGRTRRSRASRRSPRR